MARRIIDEFEDLNSEGPDQDLDTDLDEEGSDEIFSETTEMAHELDEDEVPTVEEFQRIYDEWFRLFQQKGLMPNG